MICLSSSLRHARLGAPQEVRKLRSLCKSFVTGQMYSQTIGTAPSFHLQMELSPQADPSDLVLQPVEIALLKKVYPDVLCYPGVSHTVVVDECDETTNIWISF
ncbi:hypothetical protein Tco_1377186 [Tanacetum coccineum]